MPAATRVTGCGATNGEIYRSEPRPAQRYQRRCECTGVAAVYKRLTDVQIMMVPKAGLEPARLAALPPQDSVSTNSTTSA
jgi:hypothetical protein